MVEQLPPHLHAAGGDIQAGQRSGGEGILDDVLRQEGEAHAVLDHLAEQGSTAQLEKGLDGQPLRCHALVKGIAVAHAPLGQQNLLPGQFLKRDFRLPSQWVPGGGHHADWLRLIHGQHEAGLQQRLVSV